MNPSSYDVVIVGAGIVGAACADECAQAGLRVAIVESKIIGGGATAAGMGHIVVMDDSEPQFALTRYSRDLWDELAQTLPGDSEFKVFGTIWVAADEEEMAGVRRKETFYRDRGVAVSVLNSQELARLEPNLRRGLCGGLLVPEDSVVYPPTVARHLVERAQSKGAVLYLGKSVVELNRDGVTLSDGIGLSSAITVNAAGSWSPLLTPGLEVRKRKGHLVITDRYPGFINHHLIELSYLKSAYSAESDSVAFNVQPRPSGQILIGSSRQHDATEKSIDSEILRKMLVRAQEFMPGLPNLSAVRTWTGFRPATPDNLPLIGACPGKEGLYLATGHEGLGITTSLGTAKLLVDQILKRPSQIPIEPYLPSRTQKRQAHS